MNRNENQQNESRISSRTGLLPLLMLSALAFGSKPAEGSTSVEPSSVISLDDRSGPTLRAFVEQPVNGLPVPDGLRCDDPGLRANNATDLAKFTRSTFEEAVGIAIGNGKGKLVEKALKIVVAKEFISGLGGKSVVTGPIDSEALGLYCSLERARFEPPSPMTREKIKALERQFAGRQALVKGAWENKNAEMMEALGAEEPIELAMARTKTQEFQLLKLGKMWQEMKLQHQTQATEAAQTKEEIGKIDARLGELGQELDQVAKGLLDQTADQIEGLKSSIATLSDAVNNGTVTRQELLLLTRPDLAVEFGGLSKDEFLESLTKRVQAEEEIQTALRQVQEFEDWSQAAGSVVSLFDSRAGNIVSSLGSTMTSLASLGISPSPLMIPKAITSVSNFIGMLLFGGRDVGAERHKEVMDGLNLINDNINRVAVQVNELGRLVLRGNEELHDRFDQVDERLDSISELISDSRKVEFSILRALGVTNERLHTLSQTFYEHDDAAEVHASMEARRDRESARRNFEVERRIFSGLSDSTLTPARIDDISSQAFALATEIAAESAFTGKGMLGDIRKRTDDRDQRKQIATRLLLMGESRYQREFLADVVSELLTPLGHVESASEAEFTEGVELLLDLYRRVGAERFTLDPNQLKDLKETGQDIQGTSRLFVDPKFLQAALDAYTMETANLEMIVGEYLRCADKKEAAGALSQWDLSRGIEQFESPNRLGDPFPVGVSGLSEASRKFLGELIASNPEAPTDRVADLTRSRLNKVVREVKDKGLSLDPNVFGINEDARVALGFRGDPARFPNLADLTYSIEGEFNLRPFYPSKSQSTPSVEKVKVDEGKLVYEEHHGRELDWAREVWRPNVVEYITKSLDYSVNCSPTFTFVLGEKQGSSPLAFLHVEVRGRDELVRDRFYEKTRAGKVIANGPTLVEGQENQLGPKYIKMWNEEIRAAIESIVDTTFRRVGTDQSEGEDLVQIRYGRGDKYTQITVTLAKEDGCSREITYTILPKYRPTVRAAGRDPDTRLFRPTMPMNTEGPEKEDRIIELDPAHAAGYGINFTLKFNTDYSTKSAEEAYKAAEQGMAAQIAKDAVTPGTAIYQSFLRLDASRLILSSLLYEGGSALANSNSIFKKMRDQVADLPTRSTIEGEIVASLLAQAPARTLVGNIEGRLKNSTDGLIITLQQWAEEYPELEASEFGSHAMIRAMAGLREINPTRMIFDKKS